jgi:hypothetical protein
MAAFATSLVMGKDYLIAGSTAMLAPGADLAPLRIDPKQATTSFSARSLDAE